MKVQSLYTLALALGATVCTQLAFAQTPPPPPPPGHGEMHEHRGERGAKWSEKIKERMEKHEAQMKEKLKITPAQEGAWKTFTESMTPPPRPEHPARAEMDKLTTPERMERGIERAKQHLAQMQSRLQAVKQLYSVLSAEQKMTFDRMHQHLAEKMMHRMEHRGDERRGPDGPPPRKN